MWFLTVPVTKTCKKNSLPNLSLMKKWGTKQTLCLCMQPKKYSECQCLGHNFSHKCKCTSMYTELQTVNSVLTLSGVITCTHFWAACTDTVPVLSPAFSRANWLGREFFAGFGNWYSYKTQAKIPFQVYIALSKCRSHQLH